MTEQDIITREPALWATSTGVWGRGTKGVGRGRKILQMRERTKEKEPISTKCPMPDTTPRSPNIRSYSILLSELNTLRVNLREGEGLSPQVPCPQGFLGTLLTRTVGICHGDGILGQLPRTKFP